MVKYPLPIWSSSNPDPSSPTERDRSTHLTFNTPLELSGDISAAEEQAKETVLYQGRVFAHLAQQCWQWLSSSTDLAFQSDTSILWSLEVFCSPLSTFYTWRSFPGEVCGDNHFFLALSLKLPMGFWSATNALGTLHYSGSEFFKFPHSAAYAQIATAFVSCLSPPVVLLMFIYKIYAPLFMRKAAYTKSRKQQIIKTKPRQGEPFLRERSSLRA